MNVKNLMIKPALFAVYAALMFSFIGCVVNPMETTIDESWTAVSNLPVGRNDFQAMVLPNNDILVMGGEVSPAESFANDVWLSSDGGRSWSEITNSAPWTARVGFQAVVLPNNDILIMGGSTDRFLNHSIASDIWLSKDSGRSWSQIPANGWNLRYNFQTVVLNNNNILVLGGGGEASTLFNSTILLSIDGGTNWSQIPASNHWSARRNFQSLVLANNDILVMGGYDGSDLNDIWRSSDGGTNWFEITNSAPWSDRSSFQAVALNNNDMLVLGGRMYNITSSVINEDVTILNYRRTFFYRIWSSSDGGTSWNLLPLPPVSIDASGGYDFPAIYATARYDFQAVVLENNQVLTIGGRNRDTDFSGDVWMRQF